MLKLFKSISFESAALFLIIACSLTLMVYSASGDSLVFDELAHIPAGYSYAAYLDNRLNIEHPPLVKALSAIPLLFLNLNFPADGTNWEKFNQWGIGSEFIFNSGNDADIVIFMARLGPIILTLFLIFFTFIIAKNLVGEKWALLPAFFVGLSPNVLSHGHYVTTDIGVSLFVLLAIYYFSRYIADPSLYLLFISSLFFGFAQLAKFSALILVPIFILLAVIYALGNKQWLRLLKNTASVFLSGYIIVYGFYFLFSVNYPEETQIKNTEYILGFSDSQRAQATSESCSEENLSPIFKSRCILKETFIKMSGNIITRPITQYLTGAWLVFKQSTLAHHLTYFNGTLCDCGRWYYFPILFFLKEPITGLIFILLGIIGGLVYFIKSKFKRIRIFFDYIAIGHFTEFSLFLFIIIYGIYSIQSNLNIGVRHIFPMFAPIYILAVQAFKKIEINVFYKKLIIGIIVFWHVFEVFFSAPYFISYYNEFGGGLWEGHKYAVDSNYDWGQDLKRLAEWVKNTGTNSLALDYFGAGDVKYYLGDKFNFWDSRNGNPKLKGFELFAVSIHLLRQYPEKYAWLENIGNPDYRIGTSIYIYKL